MNCYLHDRSAAVGVCAVCLRAMCRECVGVDTPRLICRTCAGRPTVFGFEYRSPVQIGGWPLVHVCTGVDPATMRPRVARGIIAIGNLAIVGLAVGGLAARLDALSPLAVLGRGYALCWNASRTAIIRTASTVAPGDRVRVTLADGELGCRVEDV